MIPNACSFFTNFAQSWDTYTQFSKKYKMFNLALGIVWLVKIGQTRNFFIIISCLKTIIFHPNLSLMENGHTLFTFLPEIRQITLHPCLILIDKWHDYFSQTLQLSIKAYQNTADTYPLQFKTNYSSLCWLYIELHPMMLPLPPKFKFSINSPISQ